MELLTAHEQIKNATFLGAFADDTPEWHALREGDGIITGSTIASIAGLNRWESSATRWFKMKGIVPDTVEVNMGMKIGKALEQPILDLFQAEHPNWVVYRTGTWEHSVDQWQRANPDALFVDERGELCLIEVKFSRTYWGGELPANYRCQVLWYLGTLGLKKAVVVGIVDSVYTEIVVEFDQFEFDWLKSKAIDFRKMLETDLPPEWDGSESSLLTARQIHPEISDEEVEVGEVLGIHLVNTAMELDELTLKLNRLKAETLDAMGTAKVGYMELEGMKLVVAKRSARNGGTPFLTVVKGKGNK